MNLDALATFAAVADTGSFTRGAERVGLPKSSVSRQIAALEKELGTRLMHRTTRRLTLTPAGRVLLARVSPHVAALTRVTAGDLDDGTSGTLRITISPDFAAAVLPGVIVRFATLYPRVRVEARLTMATVDLIGEGLDLALRITARGLPDSHLKAMRLGTVRLGLYAAPRYLARAGTPRTIDELGSYDLVGLHGPGALKEFGPLRIAADDGPFVHAVLRAGGGIGVLPTYLVSDDLTNGTLVRVLPEWTSGIGTVWLVTPHDRRPPKRVAAFRELLVEAIARSGVLEPVPA